MNWELGAAAVFFAGLVAGYLLATLFYISLAARGKRNEPSTPAGYRPDGYGGVVAEKVEKQ